jgi:N-glycosylase/DNA lyase
LPAATCVSPGLSRREVRFQVAQYDLSATLTSGQAFRWQPRNGCWEGVVGSRWVRLTGSETGLLAQTLEDVPSWDWLVHYLQAGLDLDMVLAEFPSDEPLRLAVRACRGLRLLRQDPWECLASFILSSTKQIVQIRQIIRLLCERFGDPIAVPTGEAPAYSFPGPERLALASEAELRSCKMGFRAPYLRAAAAAVERGELDLSGLSRLDTSEARARLLNLPGVGRKIADCVLLFAYGFQDSFPVDVWVSKALRELYFEKKHVTQKQLLEFSQTHFGRYAGYAQQYLFHYMRTGGRPGPNLFGMGLSGHAAQS